MKKIHVDRSRRGEVEVGQQEMLGLLPAEGVNGDERHDEFGHRAVCAVDSDTPT